MTEPVTEPQPTPPARRTSLPRLTLALAGVLVLALGFVGGIGVSRATASDQAAPPGARPGVVKSGGPGQAGTIGTVERVDGDTVYVKTPDGKTVKVTTDGDTDVSVAKKGTVADLKKGSTVVVRGEKDGDTVSAKDIDAGGNLPTRMRPSGRP